MKYKCTEDVVWLCRKEVIRIMMKPAGVAIMTRSKIALELP